MGASTSVAFQGSSQKSHTFRTARVGSIAHVIDQQKDFETFHETPFEIQVAHYTPACFPLIPLVNKSTTRICSDSWSFILEPVWKDGVTLSGLTLFYTEFYETLAHFDKMGKFESVLLHHTSGLPSIAAKGAILIRIINYALAIDIDSPNCMFMLYTLGKSHNHKRIRPWQYSIFVQTLLNTISSRLQAQATNEVMSAWTHLFAFILRAMLPVAIKGLVNETEMDINVTSDIVVNTRDGCDFGVMEQIEEADLLMELKKKELAAESRLQSRAQSRAQSRGNSSVNSPRSGRVGGGLLVSRK